MRSNLVTILCGGISDEMYESLESTKGWIKALKTIQNIKYQVIRILDKYNWILLNINPDNLDDERFNNYAYQIDICNFHYGLVIPVLPGIFGEDGTIQGFLDTLGIPYIGCNILSSAIGSNKYIAKRLISSIENRVYYTNDILIIPKNKNYSEIISDINKKIFYPFVIKYNSGGSSIDLYKINREEELIPRLDALDQNRQYIIESYVDRLMEIEICLLSIKGEVTAHVCTVKPYDIRSYDIKANEANYVNDCSVKISTDLINTFKGIAINIFNKLNCNDILRVDLFINKNNELLFNELTTMPGMTTLSHFPLYFSFEEIGKMILNRLL